MTETMKSVLAQMQAQIQHATHHKQALRIQGGGTKSWYGNPVDTNLPVLDTRAYQGIVAYDPAELVITARCGTPLAEIEVALAEQKQLLPFEPPHFSTSEKQATVGGMIAAGLSGPRRATVGSVRDFVLGTKVLDGNGQHLNFGGTVMKNVAGYDVSRLLTGSLGSLGLITEISIKVLPRSFAEVSLRFELDEISALKSLNQWAGRPLPISASAWHDGVLTLRLSGAEAAVKSAQEKLGGEPLDQHTANAFWSALREQTLAFFADDLDTSKTHCLWRLSLPTVAAPVKLSGKQLIEWGGGQRWWITEHSQTSAALVRQTAQELGGHATLFRGAKQGETAFTPLQPALLAIQQRLMKAFDPAGIFNPGCLF